MALTSEQQARLDELKNLVALRVDEYSESADNIGDDDINFGDIEHELDESMRKVLTEVDRSTVLDSAKLSSSITPVTTADGYGSILPLPADYLRFVSLTMADWKRPVTGLIPDTTSAYQQQQYSMRRGRNEQPKAFLIPYLDAQTGVVPTGFVLVENTGTVIPPLGQEMIESGLSGKTIVIVDHEGPIEGHLLAYIKTGDISVGEEYVVVGNATLTTEVKFDSAQSYNPDVSKKAVEVYPKSTSPKLVYVPALKAYEVPGNLEDALVWYTTYRVLVISGRLDSAKNAYAEYGNIVQRINNGYKGELSGQQ